VTADPDVQRFLIRAFQYVIARFAIDGFRIDTIRFLKGDSRVSSAIPCASSP